MAFVVTDRCKGVLDRGCVDACPVDCIYEGDGMLHIHPEQCIDCEACMGVCPVEAIYPERDLPSELAQWADNARKFFAETPAPSVAKGSFS